MNNKILICLLMLISLLNRTRKSGVYGNFELCLLSFKAHFGWKVKRSSVYVFCSALLSNNVCHTRLKNSGNSKPFRKILLLIGLLLVSGMSSTLAATTTQDIFYDDFERTTRLTAIPAGNSVPDWNFVRLDNDFTSDISNHTAQ